MIDKSLACEACKALIEYSVMNILFGSTLGIWEWSALVRVQCQDHEIKSPSKHLQVQLSLGVA